MGAAMRPDGPQAEDREPGTEEPGGDLSYDMAHDLGPAPARPPAAGARAGAPAPDVPPPGTDGDYSYDLAHEVPPARR